MGVFKEASKDLTEAIAIDKDFMKARVTRAILWVLHGLKSSSKIHAEFKTVIEMAHKDSRYCAIAYSMLATTILSDSRLGTYEDAKTYLEKALRSQDRRKELYGYDPDNSQEDYDLDRSLQNVMMFMRAMYIDPNLQIIHARGAPMLSKVQREKYQCLNCRKSKEEVASGKLWQCSRCKVARYCSEACQLEVRLM
jgi:hypothetical protein